MNATHRKIIGVIILLIVALYVATLVYSQSALSRQLQIEMRDTDNSLLQLATLVARDDSTDTVDMLVSDCELPNRERFDTLLASLSTLDASELAEIDILFAKCGNYFALRRSLMVAELENTLTTYQSLHKVETKSHLWRPKSSNRLEVWGQLVAIERERANLSTDLVNIQGDIISTLTQAAASEESVETLVATANAVKTQLLQKTAESRQLLTTLQ